MHHIPHPKDQAETLMRLAKARGWKLGKQDALEMVAELQGFKSWQICSAAVEANTSEDAKSDALEPQLIVEPCDDKEDKHLFVSLVTMDATMSAELGVWARNKEEAEDRLLQFAVQRYQETGGSDFQFDEGNQKDVDDFHVGDFDEMENRSNCAIEGDDMFARATWADERGSYDVIFQRDEPDCSDADRRHAVTATLTVKPNYIGVGEAARDFEGESERFSASDGELRSQLRFEIEEGNFDDDIDSLLEDAVRNFKRRARRK